MHHIERFVGRSLGGLRGAPTEESPFLGAELAVDRAALADTLFIAWTWGWGPDRSAEMYSRVRDCSEVRWSLDRLVSWCQNIDTRRDHAVGEE